jgi:hypothetical protein
MSPTQKLLLVTSSPAGVRGLGEVNDLLARGWHVASVTPMGGGGATEQASALVLLERQPGDASAVLARLEEEVDESLEGDGSEVPIDRLGLDEPPRDG